jgi:sec-independent protein translocase protein TatA
VNIFGIGLPEMAVIMVLALLVFGPKKLPEIGRSMGKAIRGFQDASKEFEAEFKREAEQIEQAVKASMEATLEPPSQPTLSPASETTSIAEPDSDDHTTVAEAETPREAASTEIAS